MTPALRGAFRLLAFGALTLGFFGLWIAGLPLVLWHRRLALSWRYRIFGTWSRCMLRLLRVRVRVRGTPPAPPFLLVSNHLSYLDVPLLASRLDTIFVSKSEVADWPVLGFMVRCMGTLFIERERVRDIPRVVARLERAFADGQGVILFPEGTSSPGAAVGAFRPALLAAAARAGRPVWYASLRYDTPPDQPPAHLAVCWWGGMGFLGHLLGLVRLSSLDAELVFGEEPVADSDRKRLARRLQERVAGQFVPVVAEGEVEWAAR